MFGHTKPTAFVIDTDRTVSAHELAHFAKVIRVYKELTPADVAEIQRRLKKGVDDLVAVEWQSMQPQLIKQKQGLETKHQRKLEAVKADPAEKAKLVAAHEAALQKLEDAARRVARERVLARLGKELALPMPTKDDRSVVAFGRMEGEQFEVTSKAYEIDVAAGKLRSEAKIAKQDGGKATLVGK